VPGATPTSRRTRRSTRRSSAAHVRHQRLVSRRDVIVVASVSCIYGLGSPEEFTEMRIPLRRGASWRATLLLEKLVDILYERNDYELKRGRFRVRGDVVDVMPAYSEHGLRVEFFGDEIEEHQRVRAAHRRGHARAGAVRPLSGQPVRHVPRQAQPPAIAGDQGRAGGARGVVLRKTRAAISRPSGSACGPTTTSRCCRDGLLQRHRELLPAPDRPQAGRAPLLPDRFLPQGLPAA
jgi:hypothetical protein